MNNLQNQEFDNYVKDVLDNIYLDMPKGAWNDFSKSYPKKKTFHRNFFWIGGGIILILTFILNYWDFSQKPLKIYEHKGLENTLHFNENDSNAIEFNRLKEKNAVVGAHEDSRDLQDFVKSEEVKFSPTKETENTTYDLQLDSSFYFKPNNHKSDKRDSLFIIW